MYLLLYVDDIILTASSTPLLHRVIGALQQEFSMKDFGEIFWACMCSVLVLASYCLSANIWWKFSSELVCLIASFVPLQLTQIPSSLQMVVFLWLILPTSVV